MADTRGSLPEGQLYFEDVEQGLEMPSKSWGPISSPEVRRFSSAADSYAQLHHDYKWCRERGFPDVLINGPMKQALLISWLDSWVGEGGFLKKMRCQHRGMDHYEHTLTARGKVTRKYQQDGLGFVECEIRLENQKGEITCPGAATVVLPKRGGPVVPVVYSPPPGYDEILDRLRQ